VASAAPVPPCVIWSFADSTSRRFTISGDPCTTTQFDEAGQVISTASIPTSASDVGPILDPVTGTQSTVLPGQIYDFVVSMVEVDRASGSIVVTGRNVADMGMVWSYGCDGGVRPAVHFSGGLVQRDPAGNRTDVDFFGSTEYVRVDCGSETVLLDPATGRSL
jgi:hypothetical protein